MLDYILNTPGLLVNIMTLCGTCLAVLGTLRNGKRIQKIDVNIDGRVQQLLDTVKREEQLRSEIRLAAVEASILNPINIAAAAALVKGQARAAETVSRMSNVPVPDDLLEPRHER